MRDFESVPESERDAAMGEIIRQAESGGPAHMDAVIDALPHPDYTTPRPPMPNDLLYPSEGGRPRYRSDNLNTTVELRLTIDGRRYLCREMVDPFLWEMQLAPDQNALESYVQYFLRKSLGGLVMDSQAMGYFRSRVFIVRPGDPHDLQRCSHSNDGQHPNLWPRCLEGFILTELPGDSPVPGAGRRWKRKSMLGYCPCRCHQRDRHMNGPRPYIPGLGTFDEDRYDG